MTKAKKQSSQIPLTLTTDSNNLKGSIITDRENRLIELINIMDNEIDNKNKKICDLENEVKYKTEYIAEIEEENDVFYNKLKLYTSFQS